MGRSTIGFGAFLGMTVGGLVPELWGAGAFSVSSIAFSLVGGFAGVWLGALVADS